MICIDLSEKVAVITGGTGELGKMMARTIASAGGNVAICYGRNENQALKLKSEIQELGVNCIAVGVDVTDKNSVLLMRDEVFRRMGSADIIVNSAVIQYKWKHVLDQPLEDYESQFRSSVLHNVLMAKAFLPAMIKRGWGRFIGINSECAMECHENQSAYVSGKRGMDGMLRVLAREVGGHGITVNQVAPGWTISENRPSEKSAAEKAYISKVPLKRRGDSQEIANVVAFLASDLAGYITGAYIPVCGGNVMATI